ncbi:ribonuclease catalytic domain-containing protein [Chitinimonas sp. BJB300]|uniref:ribonuclease catalytic domain-containing protein n=1 Tax=Chitinimonas sp. BJB300 TaxID=1559339 RepID=UPI000C108B58|nr:RNB domain-containing ribonuclease [Chitinimonas sp. BJB300]PHV10140.1 ribonuclease II [Chitinimonas sp. BJB300]TSJ91158.1 RNB domain-containing ribonuclease [Chitinimonas sp. BJB300]
MNVFYEESGDFKVAAIMSETDATLQVEDARGKRSKIKAHDIRLRFDKITLAEFIPQATVMADELDLDFLWEVAGSEEFCFTDLAVEYFSPKPSSLELAAMCVRLHANPMYFYRKGRGRYKAAPEDNLRAAKAGQEKKAREAALMAEWQADLLASRLPEALRSQVKALLHRPDKNTIEWKALAAAADAAQKSPLRLLESCGAIPDVEAWLLDGFLVEYFPKGVGFPDIQLPLPPNDLPVAGVRAFSIDDAATTEIDDALSVTLLPDGNTRVGIHIAAPTLGVAAGSTMENVVLARLSTVYFPGDKITMLPDAVVENFTLAEGRDCPAVSLYVTVTPEFEIVSAESRLDSVHIAANLRHHDLDPVFNEETVALSDGGPDYPWKSELHYLHRFAIALEKARGKHDPNRVERPDYSFAIDKDESGEKHIRIYPRKRGSPMDKLVAELMILCNSTWGKQLADARIPAIYRAQAMGRVKMTTQPSPHVGLGVAQYSWASSPLRRAADFINQQQLVAMLRGESPRYAPRDPMLFAALRDFDQTYNAYAEFQSRMERYWCLRWLEQEGISDIGATVIKENLVRFDGLPLMLRIAGLPELARGTPVKLQMIRTDYLDLALECRLLEAGEPVTVVEEEEEITEAAEAEVETAVVEGEAPLAPVAS